MDDDLAHGGQVAWEYRHLRRANVVLCWSPDSPGVDQPIAFAEMLTHAERGVRMEVGAAAGYPRRRDVVAQLKHARPGLTVWPTLEDTVNAVRRALDGAQGWAVRSVKSDGLGVWRVNVATDLGRAPEQFVWGKRRAWRAAEAVYPGRGEP